MVESAMRVWGKHERRGSLDRGVARAAVRGASREELVHEAVETLLAQTGADRVGVWLERQDNGGRGGNGAAEFHGRVANATSRSTPSGWGRLSPETQLPRELLASLRPLEESVDPGKGSPPMEALSDMQRVLWMPIERCGQLRGVLFAAGTKKNAALGRTTLEAVAAEIALALELEDQRRLTRERQNDLGATWRTLAALESSEALDTMLTNVVESCTERDGNGSGIGALFAAIGRTRDERHGDSGEEAASLDSPSIERSASVTQPDLEFRWHSGDPGWTSNLEREPLARIWRRALEQSGVAGMEEIPPNTQGKTARVVAIPLKGGRETLGVLVAGFPRGEVSLLTVERLELRAALATSAVLRQQRGDVEAQRIFKSKLQRTEKLAALGQMVTGIAHELSNPLTSILGYAQRLLLRPDAGGFSREAGQILQEAERATEILRQLLRSARDSRPERRRVALNQVVSRTVELQRFSLKGANIRLEVELDPTLPSIKGDEGQLQQVLMNLIGNARQAIEEQGKGGQIRVHTKRIASRRVLLEVSDDGPGIPERILTKIFDPFFTTKPAGMGTGLGLSIVLAIVQEHGGQVRVRNTPGGGATFSVELPASAGAVAASDTRVRREREEKSERRSHERMDAAYSGTTLAAWAGLSVLVVEDESTIARLIADVLEDEGLHVDVLLDGREALEHAGRQRYDLVVCDMKMPGIDGQRFYEALVQRDRGVKDRFLFVTGDVLAAHTRSFLERNALPHVAKPFRVEELTEQIKFILERVGRDQLSPAPVARTRVARK